MGSTQCSVPPSTQATTQSKPVTGSGEGVVSWRGKVRRIGREERFMR